MDALFASAWGPLVIFFLRIVDVSLATLRMLLAMRGVKVLAAKFESSDETDKIIDFYRNELKAYGDVTECRGDIDFRGRREARRPVCREKPFERDLQLLAGPEDRQHIVSVKPRGDGTEFALVYVQTRGRS